MSAASGRNYGNKKIPELERGSSRLLSLENSLWNRLRTGHKAGYMMVMI